jgi:UDP-glucose 4-epimerase
MPHLHYVVTGGAGFVGSHLADQLVSHGHEVTLYDNLSTGSLENVAHLLDLPGVRFVEGSTSDGDAIDELVAGADRVLHLASAVGVQLVVDQPLASLVSNVRGCETVMQACARHGKRLLYTSTSETYGKNSAGALDEDSDRVLGSPFKSRWNYAIAKSFGEALAHALHRERGAEITTVRLFNTVGPRQTGLYGMVVPRFVRQALAGEDLTVFGNGTQTRCFAHVHDSVAAILTLLERDDVFGDVFNIGTEDELPIIELARRVIEHAGSDSRISLVPYDEAYGEGFEELGRRKPDTTKLRALTGWAPTRTIDDAIDDVILHEQSRAAHQEPGFLAS